jgi:hypothetical protein
MLPQQYVEPGEWHGRGRSAVVEVVRRWWWVVVVVGEWWWGVGEEVLAILASLKQLALNSVIQHLCLLVCFFLQE